jgi:hypothetical protein
MGPGLGRLAIPSYWRRGDNGRGNELWVYATAPAELVACARRGDIYDRVCKRAGRSSVQNVKST